MGCEGGIGVASWLKVATGYLPIIFGAILLRCGFRCPITPTAQLLVPFFTK
jgi:hypothetical protein